MWSVGVILLCLLSGRYPFFRAPDDLSTLAEITTLLGTNTVRKAAATLGEYRDVDLAFFQTSLILVVCLYFAGIYFSQLALCSLKPNR